MGVMRKPFQGVQNIVRFNWHYFVLSGVAIVALLVLGSYLNSAPGTIAVICALVIAALNLISLSVSFFVYDLSALYKLNWLDGLCAGNKIVNINAGFDETSSLLKSRYPRADLIVLDFYNPEKHTEVSIKRARKTYPLFPDTRQTTTDLLPLPSSSAQSIFAILSAHEIRNNEERTVFFRELNRVLTSDGKVVLTEHLRDLPNFLAYNIGFLHFYSRKSWQKTFSDAGFSVTREVRITPFITTFILEKNGTAS